MFKFLLALHVVLVVFAIGPLVYAATTAGRGIRTGDGAATASSARVLRIYGYASVLVVLSGMGLMSVKVPSSELARRYVDYLPGHETKAGEFGDTWIWLSLVLWVIAVGIVLGVVVPTLQKATALIGEEKSVVPMTARVAAAGGVVGLIFAGIIVLMVYRPGT